MQKITKVEIVILLAVYLFGLFFWTLPFQDNSIPYGEGDASIHFFMANYMAQTDRVIVKLPLATSQWSLHDTEYNPQNYMTYAPPFYTSLAIMEATNTNPTRGLYLYLAVMSSLIFFTLYFLMRHLYGPVAGILTGFLILFSMRDHLTFLWGQWGTAAGMLFVPLVLYAYYKYTNSFIAGEEKPIYAYIFAILLAMQFLMHPLGFFIVISFLGVYTVLLLIKERKIPFSIKRMFICILIFVVLVVVLSPSQIGQMVNRFNRGVTSTDEITEPVSFFSRLFGWYNIPGGTHGVPAFYFSYKGLYYGYWMLPFLVFGIITLLFNRHRGDLLILSMLIGFYIITHLDLVGILIHSKYPRFFYFESMIFYPIIALGVIQCAKILSFKKNFLKYVMIGIFVIVVISINVPKTYTLFNTAYGGLGRLNTVEMEGIDWINENIPTGSYIALIGAPTFKQQTWTQAMIPEKVIVFDANQIMPEKDPDLNKTTYVIIDYSFLLGNVDIVRALQDWEVEVNIKDYVIYDNNGMYKVFKLER